MSNQDLEEQNQVELSEPELEQDDIEPPLEKKRSNLHNKIKGGLKSIGKTADGQMYAYTNLQLEKQNISELYDILASYPHLRKIQLADNVVRDVSSVLSIQFLTHLDLSNNQIDSLSAFNRENTLNFLEELNLTKNQLKKLEPLGLRTLKRLILSKNQIETCEEFTGHPNLLELDLSYNKLRNCQGLTKLYSMTKLSLQYNKVTSIGELADVPALKQLILNKNELEGFGEEDQLPDLPYLNLLIVSETKIRSIKEVAKLVKYKPSLTDFQVQDSPIAEEITDNLRREILMVLPFLKTVNTEDLQEGELEDALKELNDRREQEEIKRKEEEEARLLAEQEAANKPAGEEEDS